MTEKEIKHEYHTKVFIQKMVNNATIALAFLVVSLMIGILGYHSLLELSWSDSLVNASMILTGMGPVDKALTTSGKVFTSIYAIYSGVAFLTSVGFLATPVLHRVLHKFHLDNEK